MYTEIRSHQIPRGDTGLQGGQWTTHSHVTAQLAGEKISVRIQCIIFFGWGKGGEMRRRVARLAGGLVGWWAVGQFVRP